MSKFLKFIVHFVVICTIICVLALAVPPFLGIRTEIMDNSGKESNLPMGSVTYAIPVKAEEAAIGDSLLVQENSSAYRYRITAIDLANKTFTVVDPTVSGGETVSAVIKEYVPKIVLSVPLLGYLLVATESIEGLIVLGLAVLFLIILYVIAELTKKDPREDDYDYEEDDPEPGYVKSKKELKREEKAKARLYKEEERQIKKEDKQRKKNKKKIRTGGFVDEIYEDDLEPEEEEQERPTAVQAATSEAHELLKKEIAAATAEEVPAPVRKEKPVVRENVYTAEPEKQEIEKAKLEEEAEEPVEIRKLAVPVLSVAQLAEAAKRQGDAPEIIRDEVTKVTLFDYSDIIAGNEPTEE